jgi:hypothetical protein
MTRRAIIIAAILAFAVAVVAFIPASLGEAPLNQRLAPSARMQTSVGTVWSGSGTLIISDGNRAAQVEIPLKWSFAPLSLARLRLGFDVLATGPAVNGSVTVETGVLSLQVRNVELKATIEALAKINRDLSVFKPGGELQFSTAGNAVSIDYAAPHAIVGRLDFAASRVRVQSVAGLPIGVPLGSYSGNMVFEGQRVNYQIEKSTGLLALTGGGHVLLGKSKEFRYQGFASTIPGGPVWLASLLGSLGRASPDGRINIDYKTNW